MVQQYITKLICGKRRHLGKFKPAKKREELANARINVREFGI